VSGVLIPTVQWWLAVSLTGAAALPLAWRLFPGHPGLAFAFARPIGLLLAGYTWWLGAIAGVLPAGRAGAWAGALALCAAGGAAAWRGRRSLGADLRANRRLLVGLELLFAVALLGWAFYKSFSPEVTQSGGEKTMEMAFISAILESPRFPPSDPWMSGETISYYYFGFVVAAQLVHLSGVDRFVAFNLVVPMTLGMTLAGAFALGHALVALTPGASIRLRVVTGALTAAALALLGNLSGALEVAYKSGWLPAGFFRWLDIRELGATTGQGNGVCGGTDAPYDALAGLDALRLTDYFPDRHIWWWRGSRIIHDGCGEVIHEFPFFSFMLADVHPHVMALPYVLLVLALALAVLAGGLPRLPGRPPLAPAWLALPLAVGALAFLNTWDMPTYGFVLVAAFALWRARDAFDGSLDAPGRVVARRAARDTLGFAAWLVALAVLLYLPFHLGFQSQADGFDVAAHSSRAPQWLVHFGVLAALAATTIVMAARGVRHRMRRSWLAIAWACGFSALIALRWLIPRWVLVERWLLNALGSEAPNSEQWSPPSVGAWTPWFPALLVGGVVLAAAVLSVRWFRGRGPQSPATAPVGELQDTADVASGHDEAAPVAEAFAVLCVATGLLLAAGTEFLFIRDLFHNRMNTVFKLFYQAWVLLAIGGSYAVCLVWLRLPRRAAAAWSAAAAVLVALALAYPVMAVWDRTQGFRLVQLRAAPEAGGGLGPWLASLSLDGLRYWETSYSGDREAARWLAQNAPPGARLLEASGGSYSHAGRMAMATGLPTVLGPDWHEIQWRGSDALVAPRRADVEAFYRGTLDEEGMRAVLDRYDVRYVVLGDLEASTYGASAAFEQRLARLTTPVFEHGGTRIYARR